MPCLALGGDSVSKIARVGGDDECVLEDYPTLQHGGLGNLYACEGLPDDVLKIEVRTRVGEEASFSQAIRKALTAIAADSPADRARRHLCGSQRAGAGTYLAGLRPHSLQIL